MLDFKFKQNASSGERWIETSLEGKPLLTTPQLNKGTAFTEAERDVFGLRGKLPIRVEQLQEQVDRAYQQYLAYDTRLKQNIYLNNLHDKNQILFYKLLSEHLAEMLPTIYTPIVGSAVKSYSREFRQPRGLYLTYQDRDRIPQLLANRSNPEIDLIVVTDGQGVLGIGDQGIGGIDIPVAKLMVYSLCGGLNPSRTLPIFLDVGTDNLDLLNDPFYLGLRQARITGSDYDNFVDKFITAIKQEFPKVFLHWEDFGRANADRFLQRYQDQICTFNDDIQGTGAVAMAALLAAIDSNGSHLDQQRIIVYGAGTAGSGIANQVFQAMTKHYGINQAHALKQFWLIDRQGLLLSDMQDLTPAQATFARTRQEVATWKMNASGISLEETVKHVKPTILIGCSAVAGAFSETIIKSMAAHCKNPIIFPLSNPTERAEATPSDIFTWTQGEAWVATGSPFDPVIFQGKIYSISQCNNALVFPGIGLGIVSVQATRLTATMMWRAIQALSAASPLRNNKNALLPGLDQAREVAIDIAVAVADEAITAGIAQITPTKDLHQWITELYWEPEYLPIRKR